MVTLWVRYRRYSLLGLVLVAGASLLTLQQVRPGEGLWVAEAVAAVTAPVQLGFARVHRGAAELWTTYLGWKQLHADRTRLSAEVTALRLRQLRYDGLETENNRLRELFALQER